jgi:hypothetical protein
MKPPRTADDKVVALLARSGRPLERIEIAAELGWTKQRAAAVLYRLVQDAVVGITAGTQDKTAPRNGRPPSLYFLPGMEPVKQGEQPGPFFQPYTIVVTPSGREARVIAMQPGGFCEIEYRVVRIGYDPRVTIKARLLREIQPGRERPEPVRIASSEVPDPSPT